MLSTKWPIGPVSPEETSSPVTLSAAKGLGMDLHNHRDASLALSVTCAMLLRSVAKHRSRLLDRPFAALRVT